MPKKNPETRRRFVHKHRSRQPVTFLKNAFLPHSLELRRIHDLVVGEGAYADPEAMVVDESGRCWLLLSSPVDTEGFLEHISVCRGEDGFFVDLRDVYDCWQWDRGEMDSQTYEHDDDYGAVLKISGVPDESPP